MLLVLVQICTDLYRLVQTCTDLYRLVQTCTDLYRLVQTCTDVYRLVQTCADLYIGMYKVYNLNNINCLFFRFLDGRAHAV